MRSSLERDLARWERGELSVADLGLRHAGRAAGMVALYQRLTDIGGVAVPDPEPGWERLRQRLPDRPVVVPVRTVGPAFVLRRMVARPLALAAALVLLGGAVGYAAAPEAVNHRLTSIWESVEDLFGARWASRNVDVDGDDLVGARHGGIVLIEAAGRGAHAERDHALGLAHLVVDATQRRGLTLGDGTDDDEQIRLAGREARKLGAETRDVVLGSRGRHELHPAARGDEGILE
jgi:hypothetical protein